VQEQGDKALEKLEVDLCQHKLNSIKEKVAPVPETRHRERARESQSERERKRERKRAFERERV